MSSCEARGRSECLFLADRDALVEQALTDGFKAHLPQEPRARIHTGNIDKTNRLYVATLQTMGGATRSSLLRFFDLIVFDEAHRSIFNRFTEVIEYFDARMVGLTATPPNFIDRDTFRVFGCHGPDADVPLHVRAGDQGEATGRLPPVPGADWLPAERHPWRRPEPRRTATPSIEQGIDPDDTRLRRHRSRSLGLEPRHAAQAVGRDHGRLHQGSQPDNLPGKTIVFAMTKTHAERIRDVFEEMFPQHVGVVQVIHHGMERVHDGPYGDGLISKFKKNDKPRIAVSVDMLDTGIDVPEVVNLVFMKPVHSHIKLWQMIGRGTRNQEACKLLRPTARRREDRVPHHRLLAERLRSQPTTRPPSRNPGARADSSTRGSTFLKPRSTTATGEVHKQAIRELPRDAQSRSAGFVPRPQGVGRQSRPRGTTPSGCRLTRRQGRLPAPQGCTHCSALRPRR